MSYRLYEKTTASVTALYTVSEGSELRYSSGYPRFERAERTWTCHRAENSDNQGVVNGAPITF
jgi:hypothetical protein